MNFQEDVQRLIRESDLKEDLADEDLEEAWTGAHSDIFEIHKIKGAYHLWETGFVEGDASDEDMLYDAKILGVDTSKEGWETTLLMELDGLFLYYFGTRLREIGEELKKELDEAKENEPN